MTTLFVNDSGEFRQASAEQILRCAKAALARRFRAGSPVLGSPSYARTYLRVHVGALPYEVFGCLHLDGRRRLIAHEELFRGTIDGATIYPREIVRSCLQHNTSALIVYHNHPSGQVEPSQADELITQRLKLAVATIDVAFLDHWVVGDSICSFAERGLI